MRRRPSRIIPLLALSLACGSNGAIRGATASAESAIEPENGSGRSVLALEPESDIAFDADRHRLRQHRGTTTHHKHADSKAELAMPSSLAAGTRSIDDEEGADPNNTSNSRLLLKGQVSSEAPIPDAEYDHDRGRSLAFKGKKKTSGEVETASRDGAMTPRAVKKISSNAAPKKARSNSNGDDGALDSTTKKRAHHRGANQRKKKQQTRDGGGSRGGRKKADSVRQKRRNNNGPRKKGRGNRNTTKEGLKLQYGGGGGNAKKTSNGGGQKRQNNNNNQNNQQQQQQQQKQGNNKKTASAYNTNKGTKKTQNGWQKKPSGKPGGGIHGWMPPHWSGGWNSKSSKSKSHKDGGWSGDGGSWGGGGWGGGGWEGPPKMCPCPAWEGPAWQPGWRGGGWPGHSMLPYDGEANDNAGGKGSESAGRLVPRAGNGGRKKQRNNGGRKRQGASLADHDELTPMNWGWQAPPDPWAGSWHGGWSDSWGNVPWNGAKAVKHDAADDYWQTGAHSPGWGGDAWSGGGWHGGWDIAWCPCPTPAPLSPPPTTYQPTTYAPSPGTPDPTPYPTYAPTPAEDTPDPTAFPTFAPTDTTPEPSTSPIEEPTTSPTPAPSTQAPTFGEECYWYFWGGDECRGDMVGPDQEEPEFQSDLVIDVSAGSRHSFYITNAGDAYVSGFIESLHAYKGHLGVSRDQLEEGANGPGGLNDYIMVDKVVNSAGATVSAPDFVQVYAGAGAPGDSRDMHSLLIDSRGNVYIAGNNDMGQLCQGDTKSRDVFTQVPNLPGPAAMAAVGLDFTIILLSDGRVYGCGSNENGEIGLGPTKSFTTSATQIPMLTNIEEVSAGLSFSLYRQENGKVYGSGSNLFSQMCQSTDGDYVDAPMELVVDGVSQIFAGRESSYFLSPNGSVQSCGRNDEGQLGDGTFEDSDKPVKVDIPKGLEVRELGSGPSSQSVFFIIDDHIVYAAGQNYRHQLGIGEINDPVSEVFPVLVEFPDPDFSSMHEVQKISSSGVCTVAITCLIYTESPTSYPTTNPTEFPTAYPTETPTEFPTNEPTVEPTRFPSVSPTILPTQYPTETPTNLPTVMPTQFPTMSPTFLTDEPTLEPTLEPSFSPTQSPTFITDEPTLEPSVSPTFSPTFITDEPTLEPTLEPSVSPTFSPTFLTDEPTANPTLEPSVSPTQSPTFITDEPTTAPTETPTFTPTLSPTLAAVNWYYWGAEEGRGNTLQTNQQIPEEILGEIIDVCAGSRHTFLIQGDGTAIVAGFIESDFGYRGHLGVGPVRDCKGGNDGIDKLCEGENDPLIVEQVVDTSGKLVAAPEFERAYCGVGVPADSGEMHSMLVSKDGRVYISGNNNKGQLCLSTDDDYVEYFHEVPLNAKAQAGAIGEEFSLILTEKGEVYGCGSNEVGEIGQGENVDISDKPVKIDGLEGIDDLSTGLSFALFLDKDKSRVWATGSNLYMQQCGFTQGAPYTEVREIKIQGTDDVVQIESNRESSYFLFADGEVGACGRNDEGQLGDGTFVNSQQDKPLVKVKLPEGINRLGAGPSAQSVFFIADEAVYAAGLNDRYQLGIDKIGSQETPVKVEFECDVEIEFVSASGSHTVANGRYLGCGGEA